MDQNLYQACIAPRRAALRRREVFRYDRPLSNLGLALRTRLQPQARFTTVYVKHDRNETMTPADQSAVPRNGDALRLDAAKQAWH